MENIENLWALQDEELFYRLGEAASQGEAGLDEMSRSDLITRGKRWLEAKKSDLVTVVCSSSKVRAALKDDDGGKTLAATIIDAVQQSTLQLSPLPHAVIALLFFRLSYYHLCKEFKTAGERPRYSPGKPAISTRLPRMPGAAATSAKPSKGLAGWKPHLHQPPASSTRSMPAAQSQMFM